MLLLCSSNFLTKFLRSQYCVTLSTLLSIKNEIVVDREMEMKERDVVI